jgi:hypothetical protein
MAITPFIDDVEGIIILAGINGLRRTFVIPDTL